MNIVNTVWKWKTANQFPVIVRDIVNEIDNSSYPKTVIFENVKGNRLALSYSSFLGSLEKTDYGPMKFIHLKKALGEFL